LIQQFGKFVLPRQRLLSRGAENSSACGTIGHLWGV
jgi:hypothetical protein